MVSSNYLYLSHGNFSDKININFFLAAVMSILLYGCTTWTLTKNTEKKQDGNCTRMWRAIVNKSLKQYPTKQPPYGHLPPISKSIQIRRTNMGGHFLRSKDEIISDVLLWTPSRGHASVGRLVEPIYNSSVRTQNVALKTCRKRWMIKTNGVRETRKLCDIMMIMMISFW